MGDRREHATPLRGNGFVEDHLIPVDSSVRPAREDADRRDVGELPLMSGSKDTDITDEQHVMDGCAPATCGNIEMKERRHKEAEAGIDDYDTSSATGGSSDVPLMTRYAGSFITLVAVILMTFADICIEITTAVMDPLQVTAIFAASMFITALSLTVISGHAFKCHHMKGALSYLVMCGLANSGALTLINVSINFIPVGDAISILRCMPVFAGIFGCIFLKQSLKIIDLVLTFFCIVGVVLIVRPTFIFRDDDQSEFSQKMSILGACLALLSAILFAASFVLGPKLDQRNVHSFVIITVNAFFAVLINVTLMGALRSWTSVDQLYHLGLNVIGGVLHAVGQVLVFVALTKTRTVVVSVVLASEIILIYILQIAIVRIIPHWLSGLGALIIMVACVGISVRRERFSHGEHQSLAIGA